jgi:hypothetical protein
MADLDPAELNRAGLVQFRRQSYAVAAQLFKQVHFSGHIALFIHIFFFFFFFFWS